MKIELKKEELSKRKLFVGTPMYGGQCLGSFSRSMVDLGVLCAHWGIELKIHYLFNESLVQRGRNYIADEFMRSGSTHLMFIDADIGFDPRDIIAMLAMMSDDSPYDVLTGPYPKKSISWEKIKVAVDRGFADDDPNQLERFVGDFVFNPVSGAQSIPLSEPAEVSESGTGFMMIRRSIMEKFTKEFPEQSYRPDHVRTEHFDGSREITAFFDCPIDRGYTFGEMRRLIQKLTEPGDVDTLREEANKLLDAEKTASKRYLSEDYYFTQMVRKIGGKVWLCPWMKLQHTGTYIFGGSLVDMAALGVTPTADPAQLKKGKKKKK